MEKVNRLGWSAGFGLCFREGWRVGFRVSDERALEPILKHCTLPDWLIDESSDGKVEFLLSYKVGGPGKRKGVFHNHVLYVAKDIFKSRVASAVYHELRESFSQMQSVHNAGNWALLRGASVKLANGKLAFFLGQKSGVSELAHGLREKNYEVLADSYALLSEDGTLRPLPLSWERQDGDGYVYENNEQKVSALPVSHLFHLRYVPEASSLEMREKATNASLFQRVIGFCPSYRNNPALTHKGVGALLDTAKVYLGERAEAESTVESLREILSKKSLA